MFTKVSRYRNIPTVTALDAKGRTLTATDARLLPSVTGTVQHTVSAMDRLDQVAYQFYSQSLQWWNICDGNPSFLWPLAMLGQTVMVETRFAVTPTGTSSWAVLLLSVESITGVEDVRICEDITLAAQSVIVAGQPMPVYTEQISQTVFVTYNTLNVTVPQLATAIEAAGFQVAPPVEMGQIGQNIVIPPQPVG